MERDVDLRQKYPAMQGSSSSQRRHTGNRELQHSGTSTATHANTATYQGCGAARPPSLAAEKMDRMKIIKRRLSMSLRSARPVDETLSELAEQINLEEPPVARDNEDTGNIYTVPFKYLAMSFLEQAHREKEWVKNQNKGVIISGRICSVLPHFRSETQLTIPTRNAPSPNFSSYNPSTPT
ncbi:unnamed protein product [Arctogadus glacialis]